MQQEKRALTKEEIRIILKAIRQDVCVPVIRILPDHRDMTLTGSKISGLPYLPHDGEVPRDRNNVQMKMLAQINFSEMEAPKPFPSTGMLQFWIAADDDVWGLNFDDQTDQSGFRVIYYLQVEQDVLPEEVEQKMESISEEAEESFPVQGATAIRFSVGQEGLTVHNEELIEKYFASYQKRYAPDTEPMEVGDLFDELYEDITEEMDYPDGCKLGGFPAFTQCDPRGDGKDQEYDVLLFQVGSEEWEAENVEILWGDCGICNFFIPLAKLKQCQFDDVLYNWDCC